MEIRLDFILHFRNKWYKVLIETPTWRAVARHLEDIVKTPVTIALVCWLLVAAMNPFPAQAATGSTIPTFSIVNVIPDTSVTILTYNFPVNRTFDVLMGPVSTRGIGGIKLKTINSGAGGSFSATFNIPPALYGQYQIALRLENTTGSGYFAYNWFYNNRYGTIPTVPATNGKPIPTIAISQVIQDKSVTVATQNFPANDRFEVLMGYMGSRGIGGIVVDTVSSGAGGSQVYSFAIPIALRGQPQIAIRFQSVTGSDYYAFNWFINASGGSYGWPASPPSPGYAGYPTISIQSVVRDQSVDIITHNLPPNDRFQVTMGTIGTRGIGGPIVGTIDSGTEASQTLTFAIPASLYGVRQIAIRIQSVTGSNYYAYNWFYNSTTQ
jgi:hypothetical protein